MMDSNVKINQFQLYDHCLPPLAAGNYTITASQRVNDPQIPGTVTSQKFSIGGARFRLEPTDINSVFPPENSKGQFGGSLPHIALNRRALPWERSLTGHDPKIPWMALLLFDKSEIKATLNVTVAELRNEQTPVIKPDLHGVTKDELKTPCTCIEIEGRILKAILPDLAELPYLTHCRIVNTDHKSVITNGAQHLSVVVGARFPVEKNDATGRSGVNIVHLVSLDGLENYLAEGRLAPDQRIRLISLASWSFNCLPEGKETFRHLAQGLATGVSGINSGKKGDGLLLRLPTPPPAGPATNPDFIGKNYLYQGYVALNYHILSGEEAFGWYRGPLTPYKIGSISKTQPFYSATTAMIYDETAGLFDLSLATAWQAGRMTALGNSEFTSKLLYLYQKIHHLTDLLWERMKLLNIDKPSEDLIKNDLPESMFRQLLAGGVITAIGKAGADKLFPPGETSTASPGTPDPIKVLPDFFSNPTVKDLIKETIKTLEKDNKKADQDALESVRRFLTKLRLFYNLPFYYLVPDERMLPVESLRFFHVDPNWTAALLDGALSLGIHTSRDLSSQSIVKELVSEGSKEAKSGILIRSALISGWPGMNIQAIKGAKHLIPLRLEKLSEDVLLCLFEETPEILELSEPEEQFHFGVDEEGCITLRDLREKPGVYLDRMQILAPGQNFLKSGADNVLRIADLAKALCSHNKVGQGQPLTPSAFAMQMIRTPTRITFKNK